MTNMQIDPTGAAEIAALRAEVARLKSENARLITDKGVRPVSEPAMYEYIRISLDMGDLSRLNVFGSSGWHVILVKDGFALLERQIPEEKRKFIEEYYSSGENQGGRGF